MQRLPLTAWCWKKKTICLNFRYITKLYTDHTITHWTSYWKIHFAKPVCFVLLSKHTVDIIHIQWWMHSNTRISLHICRLLKVRKQNIGRHVNCQELWLKMLDFLKANAEFAKIKSAQQTKDWTELRLCGGHIIGCDIYNRHCQTNKVQVSNSRWYQVFFHYNVTLDRVLPCLRWHCNEKDLVPWGYISTT